MTPQARAQAGLDALARAAGDYERATGREPMPADAELPPPCGRLSLRHRRLSRFARGAGRPPDVERAPGFGCEKRGSRACVRPSLRVIEFVADAFTVKKIVGGLQLRKLVATTLRRDNEISE